MIIVPYVGQVEALIAYLTSALTLRLFSNNLTPDVNSTAASFTEVSGGGYANKALTLANWIFTNSSQATYNASQLWTFTGVTGAPGTIYGYYVIRNSDGKVMFSERFPTVPFTPVAGSQISLTPLLTLINQ